MLNWKKKTIGAALAFGLGLTSFAAQAVTLKVSSPTNNDVILKWMEGFKQNVEKHSKGGITVEIYPANQLGQIPATVEGVMFGTIEITAPASGFFVKLDPRFEVFDVPGLFNDFESAQRVLSDPEILDRISTYGNDKGVTTIAAFPHGPLALLTIDGVRKVADISGKKIRVAGPSPLHVAPYRHMGAAPLSMPLGEVLSAMQTRTVDGLLAGVPVYTTGKYYDVAKPMTVLPKSYLIVTAVASKAFLEQLDPELADLVKESARQALSGANTWNAGSMDKAFEIWKQNGGEIIEFSPEEEKRYLDAVDAVMPEVLKANTSLKGEIDTFKQVQQRLGG
ncbi:TRAP transporter substrate-binding protein [Pusillimonas sp.]|uniref:TRAP transporter substrate-binding protein n=1 Tax=Pusillimonas sp. TaxID=3040095 RepID=UPI0029A19384|nr:TRAP transporter substrate-binding protein [Pusillimonas sp.]MDX3895065.1 TRAP transporter substrate-binding protein [Pusillimonas sp.]